MKNLNLIFGIAILAIILSSLFTSCEKKEVTSENEQIESTGFICPHSEHLETKQLINENGPGWTPCEAAGLTVFIPECLNAANEPVWNTAINNAFTNYNNVPGTSINITVLADAGDADIVLTCDNRADCFGGNVDGNFVNTGMSSFINLNTGFDLANCRCAPGGLDLCSATFVVMHEMMHALGFFHNDSNHSHAVLVDGTPNTDANSVINSGAIADFCNLPCNFSNFDILALQTVYPESAACPSCQEQVNLNIEGPLDLCVGDVGTFCVTGLHPDWTATMTSSGSTPVSGANFCQDFVYTDARIHRVYVRACHNDLPRCCVDQTIEVSVVPEEGECYCVCEAQEQYGEADIEEWKFKVDCCDERDCSELVPNWWDEYLVDRRECFTREVDCKLPAVTLGGPNEVCVGRAAEFCVAGSFSGSTTWSSNGGTVSYSSSKCRNFTPHSPGSYTITVEVCDRASGEGQEDCCETLTKTIVAVECDEECYCECSDSEGDIVQLPIDCNDERPCDDVYYEDDINDCVKKRR